MSSNSHPSGRHFLQIPGPSNIPDSVLRAMSQAIVDHRGPGFPSLTHEILDQLRPIFNTQSHIIIYPSSGTGAWEAALVNTLSPGDKILAFGEKLSSYIIYEISKNYDVKLRVDANGGWDVNQTLDMMDWLNEREVDYIEQPIKEGDESDLKYIFERRKMPIYLDESCRYAKQIPLWAKYVDGINLKLMKCGGITEGLKIINTARAHGLKTMIGLSLIHI